MLENCVPTRMFENCKKTGPPSPVSKRTGPPVLLQFSNKSGVRKLAVRKLQEEWSPQPGIQEDWSTSVVAVFEQKRGCSKTARRLVPPVLCQFSNVRNLQEDWSPMFENCKKTGPPVLLQFSNKPGMFENCKKTGPTIVVAVFERSKTARRMVPPCSKTARIMVHFVEKCKNTGGKMFEKCNRV